MYENMNEKSPFIYKVYTFYLLSIPTGSLGKTSRNACKYGHPPWVKDIQNRWADFRVFPIYPILPHFNPYCFTNFYHLTEKVVKQMTENQ